MEKKQIKAVKLDSNATFKKVSNNYRLRRVQAIQDMYSGEMDRKRRNDETLV